MQYDCRCLRKAMKGIGNSDDDVIAEILAARPNEYIEALKVILTDLIFNRLTFEPKITDRSSNQILTKFPAVEQFSSVLSQKINFDSNASDFRAKIPTVTGLRAENQFWAIFGTKIFYWISSDKLILINFWAKNKFFRKIFWSIFRKNTKLDTTQIWLKKFWPTPAENMSDLCFVFFWPAENKGWMPSMLIRLSKTLRSFMT